MLQTNNEVACLTVGNIDNNSWGPERETYTWEKPASVVTFNAITNNPSLGDERNFVRVRECENEKTSLFDDYVDGIEAGKIYEVYVYYHNDAAANFNSEGVGIAQNVRLKIECPQKLKKGQTAVIKGIITWGTDGNWRNVWDTAFLSNVKENLTLKYCDNSATLHNAGNADGQILDASAMFNSECGVLLAYNTKYWGVIPGCNEYAGYVTFKLKACKVDE